jgi:hypothetical protein
MDSMDSGHDSSPLDTDWRVIPCPICQCPLVLHQPDREVADRLLATCDDCKSWFLLTSGSAELTQRPHVFDDALWIGKLIFAGKRTPENASDAEGVEDSRSARGLGSLSGAR